ncbi:unnamed protein product [Gongylonema pulchrum]|uniref:BAT2_N domain-containing protein n=1 Tax=Gongylonema pulchrum TaxID=637853 RepID=A0A183DPW4_9BILA|nr:unnamed protein product [Gongylonema pulchrum]
MRNVDNSFAGALYNKEPQFSPITPYQTEDSLPPPVNGALEQQPSIKGPFRAFAKPGLPSAEKIRNYGSKKHQKNDEVTVTQSDMRSKAWTVVPPGAKIIGYNVQMVAGYIPTTYLQKRPKKKEKDDWKSQKAETKATNHHHNSNMDVKEAGSFGSTQSSASQDVSPDQRATQADWVDAQAAGDDLDLDSPRLIEKRENFTTTDASTVPMVALDGALWPAAVAVADSNEEEEENEQADKEKGRNADFAVSSTLSPPDTTSTVSGSTQPELYLSFTQRSVNVAPAAAVPVLQNLKTEAREEIPTALLAAAKTTAKPNAAPPRYKTPSTIVSSRKLVAAPARRADMHVEWPGLSSSSIPGLQTGNIVKMFSAQKSAEATMIPGPQQKPHRQMIFPQEPIPAQHYAEKPYTNQPKISTTGNTQNMLSLQQPFVFGSSSPETTVNIGLGTKLNDSDHTYRITAAAGTMVPLLEQPDESKSTADARSQETAFKATTSVSPHIVTQPMLIVPATWTTSAFYMNSAEFVTNYNKAAEHVERPRIVMPKTTTQAITIENQEIETAKQAPNEHQLRDDDNDQDTSAEVDTRKPNQNRNSRVEDKDNEDGFREGVHGREMEGNKNNRKWSGVKGPGREEPAESEERSDERNQGNVEDDDDRRDLMMEKEEDEEGSRAEEAEDSDGQEQTAGASPIFPEQIPSFQEWLASLPIRPSFPFNSNRDEDGIRRQSFSNGIPLGHSGRFGDQFGTDARREKGRRRERNQGRPNEEFKQWRPLRRHEDDYDQHDSKEQKQRDVTNRK